MTTIVLNIDSINAAALRIGRPDVVVTASEPVTCELVVRLHLLLGMDLAALGHVIDELRTLAVAG
ncbi:MAG TPA: hypothetical protein VIP82_20630 [Microbacterium sp.]|uniref:hypothetical protein n=1 Tax=Microbacterium sp. TaxID=51671 RepID=UPI002F93A50F